MDSHTPFSHELRTNSKERTATTINKPKKSRSKVWEKVAWFTRKTKTSKDSKSNSSQETQKDCPSPCLKRRQFNKLDARVVELRETSCTSHSQNISPNIVKAKSKSGIRKARSFNYLKRKKLGHHNENAECSKSDLIENNPPAEMATGTFCDFESTRRRTSRTSSASCCNLLNEITREANLKRQGQEKGNAKSSLSLPMSLLSIGENSSRVSSQSNSQSLLHDRMGPTYNSWPRKKRNFRSNHYIEAFSPPQKQKRMTTLRKTATFNGFDKLSVNEDKMINYHIKSTPTLDSQDSHIRNQNGLDIGVIHFFKSPSISTVKTTNESDCSGVKCAVEIVHQSERNIQHDDSDEFYMMNAHSSLCEFFESKDWSNEQLELFSHELNCPSDELSEHSNSIIEHKKSTCPFPESLIENHSKRPLENETCSPEDDQEKAISLDGVYQIKPHIVDDKKMKVEIPSHIKHSRPEKHLEVIQEVSDSIAEDNSLYTRISSNGGTIADSNDAQCTTVNQQVHTLPPSSKLVDDSSPSYGIPRINEISFDECLLQTNETCSHRDTNEAVESVSCFTSDNGLQYDNLDDKLSLPGFISDANMLANTNISTDISVYCIKIEGQATDFLEKKDEYQHVLPQKTITVHAENGNIESLKQCENTEESNFENISNLSAVNNYNLKDLDNSLLPSLEEEEEPKEANLPHCSYSDSSSCKELDFKDCFDISSEQFTSQAILKQKIPKVDGQKFKQDTEIMLDWFSNFNNEQKNIFVRRLLEKCELPQMHMLSVIMESALHKTCPSNCQDMLAWLPHPVTEKILSFLDPVSLCQCSQVNKLWNNLASNQVLWKGLCRSNEWQLSRNAAKKQNAKYTLPSGIIQWKKMFAERFLLRRKWLNGRCRVRTFEGHTQGISCVQFDDTRIVSGSSDKTIKVWDLSLDDGHAVLTLAGHSGTVRCLNLNGNRLVSGSVDKSIKVWDLSFESYWSGASCKVTMIGHMHTVRCLQVDDQKVVSGSYDKTLKVWDIKTGHCKLTLRGHNAAVLCVQFDDTKIVSGSYDNTIKVWSLQEGECLMTLTGHHDAVTCLNLTQDGRKVISGSLDHNLKFWDLATGRCIGTLDWIRSEGHTGVIRCLQSDSWRIVSAGDDKTLKMWSLETGQRLLTLRCHTDGVTCLQFNDYMIVSGSYDKTVKVWSFTPEHEFLNSS